MESKRGGESDKQRGRELGRKWGHAICVLSLREMCVIDFVLCVVQFDTRSN